MSLMYMVQLKYTKDALMAIIDQQQDRTNTNQRNWTGYVLAGQQSAAETARN